MHTQLLSTEEFLLIKFLTDRYYNMAKIKITKRKSSIGSTARQKATLTALGLGKINSSAEHEETDQIKGMIRKVNHLISVEKIK